MVEILKQQLSQSIDETLIEELLREYQDIINCFYIGDSVKILSASGRFVEIVLAIISYIHDKKIVNLNNISVESLYKKIIDLPKNNGEEELIYLEIPRVARAIYTIRSKKRGAHRKDLDPIIQDRIFIKAGADWIMSSFIFLYHTKSDKEISILIDSLLEKKVPFIEEFDDKGIVVLKKGIDFKWTILLILYHFSRFVDKRELKKLSKPKYPQILDTSIRALEDDKYIFVDKSEIKITKLGIQKIEKDIFRNN